MGCLFSINQSVSLRCKSSNLGVALFGGLTRARAVIAGRLEAARIPSLIYISFLRVDIRERRRDQSQWYMRSTPNYGYKIFRMSKISGQMSVKRWNSLSHCYGMVSFISSGSNHTQIQKTVFIWRHSDSKDLHCIPWRNANIKELFSLMSNSQWTKERYGLSIYFYFFLALIIV